VSQRVRPLAGPMTGSANAIRDPYAAAYRWGDGVAAFRKSLRRWLWVPAFARTTVREFLPHTGNAIEYFTWLSAKLDSIEAMPSSRVSLFFKNASYEDRSAATTRKR
jgi:hypothetical protein